MANIFNQLYNFLLKIFEFIYNNLSFNDFGIAIIVLTIFIRIILFPIFYKSSKDQLKILKIKPEIEKIQKEFKGDKQKMSLALMELYQKNKINPFYSFLFILIQIPILIGLYKLFSYEINVLNFDNLNFLGLINLKESNLFLALLAGLSQFLQSKIMLDFNKKNLKKEEKIEKTEKNEQEYFKEIFNKSFTQSTLYFMPFLTFIILLNLPSGLGLYWSVSNFFSIGQQYILNKKLYDTR